MNVRDEVGQAVVHDEWGETPFGKQLKAYPPIVELAKRLGRTPSSVGMKLCNFTSLDPAERERGIQGLSGASQLDRVYGMSFMKTPAMLSWKLKHCWNK